MELIPILSLIVLVATISTFILAVGAYVLYKVRESKGRRIAPPVPQTIEAELYAPQQRIIPSEIPGNQQRPVILQEPVYQESDFRQGRPAYAQMQPERAYQQQVQQAPQMVRSHPDYNHNNHNGNGKHNGNGEHLAETETENRDNKKFMKYTSEGYIPVNKATKTGDNLKWR